MKRYIIGGAADFLGKAFVLSLRPLGAVCFLHSLLLYIKIERIDCSLYALTLCCITYSVVIVVMAIETDEKFTE